MNNRAFSKIWIVFILLILIGGGILAWQYFNTPEEEIKDETADWKTYSNEEYRFEIKYPQQLFTKERFSVTQFGEKDYILLKEIMIDDEEGNDNDNQIFNIRVYNNLSNLRLSEWLNNNRNSDERGCGILSLNTATSVTINGKDGLRGDVSCCCGTFLNSVFLLKGNKIYSIGLSGTFISDEYYKGIFDKVLSTFRFLE